LPPVIVPAVAALPDGWFLAIAILILSHRTFRFSERINQYDVRIDVDVVGLLS
jgi:hypothetical protein